MKRMFTGTCLAAALGFALSASAQTPAPQGQTPAPSPSASASLDREVKLSGCLKAGSAAGTFELANVKKDKATSGAASASAQPPAATAGQAPAQDAMAAAGAKNVKLSPSPGVDLAAHVNHQVELAGAWSAAGASGAAASPGAAADKAKTFNVTSVKMIAPSCTTGTN